MALIGALSTTTTPASMALEGRPPPTASVASTSARSSFFSGSYALEVNSGDARVTCRKEAIHPKFFPEARVFCKGEHVVSLGGTQAEYVVDVWSGNHPFYQGNKTALVLDADRVDRFKKRYGDLGNLNTIPVLEKGEVIFEKKKKGGRGKGGKK